MLCTMQVEMQQVDNISAIVNFEAFSALKYTSCKFRNV